MENYEHALKLIIEDQEYETFLQIYYVGVTKISSIQHLRIASKIKIKRNIKTLLATKTKTTLSLNIIIKC